MFKTITRTTFITAIFTGCVNGQLAMLNEPPWIGYFAVHEGNRFNFGVTAHGAGALRPIGRKGEPLPEGYHINVFFGIEEIMPDASIKRHPIVEGSLVSDVPPSPKLAKSGFKGKTTGGATFEVFLEQDRGIIQVGGRVVDRGQLTVNPVRFVVGFSVPDPYPYVNRGNESPGGRKLAKAFNEMIRNDYVALRTTDGNQARIKFEKGVEELPVKIRNSAITSAVVEMKPYQGKSLRLQATPGSVIYMPVVEGRPLSKGFSFRWFPEPGKDPEGKARVAIDFR